MIFKKYYLKWFYEYILAGYMPKPTALVWCKWDLWLGIKFPMTVSSVDSNCVVSSPNPSLRLKRSSSVLGKHVRWLKSDPNNEKDTVFEDVC
jgi:hypothetical protein